MPTTPAHPLPGSDRFERIARVLATPQHELSDSGAIAPDPRGFVRALRATLFPHFRASQELTAQHVRELHEQARTLTDALRLPEPLSWADDLIDHLPELARRLYDDARMTLERDPAADNIDEIIIAYPGFAATVIHRVAHHMHLSGVHTLPRILSEYAHAVTGVDIHPGAVIGDKFVIDHGTGVVIGATSHIGRRVTIYQGVTLGAVSVRKSAAASKRHPTIEDDVVIYANATILGGRTVIGAGSIIGGNVWLTASVAPRSIIVGKPETPPDLPASDEYVI